MLKNNLGYPRIGSHRQLKKACEQYWSGKISREELFRAGRSICHENWQQQKDAGIDLIPCNDFSFYDHVLDMSFLLGAIPARYAPVLTEVKGNSEIDLYFAMARGYQKDGIDLPAMEMTKWFDTNYHYIVPEFTEKQEFRLFSEKPFAEFTDAKRLLGMTPKPVLIGPVSYLLLGKEKVSDASGPAFRRISLIRKLVPVYVEILSKFRDHGASWIQLDEPFLSLDLTAEEKEAFKYAYAEIARRCPGVRIMLATYFEGLGDNAELACSLPVSALHVDLVRCPEQLEGILSGIPERLMISLGVVDGRNVWINNYRQSAETLGAAADKIGEDRLMIAPSCSLIHVPVDLTGETELLPDVKSWMAFAKQKLAELSQIEKVFHGGEEPLRENTLLHKLRGTSALVNNPDVRERVAALKDADASRRSPFQLRQEVQREDLKLPLLPTTTIGSYPQTSEIRQLRLKLKRGEINESEYTNSIEEAILETIKWQEEVGLDVLVHGEFERNDMVEYFGELLEGFAFTRNGWVQSYGSRCVKPPVLFGDVRRGKDMTVRWTEFAQAHTSHPVKGMLTGPVTILQWSFVRDDQPRRLTALQIALAIRDEVQALESAGISIIQIDEPALREGLPLRNEKKKEYLDWAVKAFRVSASGVQDKTQIHTHMCYCEFNDIIQNIADMDADVITIETSRSQMDLLEAFSNFRYPNEIGPGVYDIHSPRIPSAGEMIALIEKASRFIPVRNLWINPDCGLKTRGWEETRQALTNMVQAARTLRESVVMTAAD